MEANEKFSHYSNFNQQIGETVNLNINLKRTKCKEQNFEYANLIKVGDLSTITAGTNQDDESIKANNVEKIIKEKNPLKLIKRIRKVFL